MTTTHHKAGPQQLWAGAAALFLLSAAANMASPLYPLYQQAYRMPDVTMTLLYATFAATAIPALLLFGSAADALGRKPVLLAGLCCAAGGTALFAVDGVGVSGLFVARVLLGVGLGLGTGAGIAFMVEASPAHRPALGSTGATIAFVAGTGGGPVLAGLLAARTSTMAVPFLVMLAALGLGALLVATLRTGRPLVRQRWRPTWPAVPAQMRSSFTISAVTGFLGWCAVGVFLALLPSMAESVMADPSPAVSGILAGAVLLVSALSQLWAPHLQPRAAQTVGLSALAIGTALLLSSSLPLFTSTGVLAVMAAAALITGAGHGISYWGAGRETDSLTPPNGRAGVTAALYLAFYAGAGMPAVGVGVLSMTTSLTWAITLVSLIMMLAMIAFLPVPSLVQTTIFRPRRQPEQHARFHPHEQEVGASGATSSHLVAPTGTTGPGQHAENTARPLVESTHPPADGARHFWHGAPPAREGAGH